MTATFVSPYGSFTLSSADKLWAARGILGEGGENPGREVMSAYLWAIARRCLLRGNSMSYGATWRAFAQPINPRWQDGGEFCRVGGSYHGKDPCSPDRLRRRARISATTWEKIPEGIRSAVDLFASGELPKPAMEKTLAAGRNRLSNWASYAGVESKFPWGIEISGEWFLEDKGLKPGDVEIQTKKKRPVLIASIATLAMVVGVAFMVVKS